MANHSIATFFAQCGECETINRFASFAEADEFALSHAQEREGHKVTVTRQWFPDGGIDMLNTHCIVDGEDVYRG